MFSEQFSKRLVFLSQQWNLCVLASWTNFPGILLDSIELQASILEEKLVRIRSKSDPFLSNVSVSKRAILSLLGHLNFAIIPQDSSFISRLFDSVHSVENVSDIVVLDEGWRPDLSFWSRLLSDWNAISFFFITANAQGVHRCQFHYQCCPYIHIKSLTPYLYRFQEFQCRCPAA